MLFVLFSSTVKASNFPDEDSFVTSNALVEFIYGFQNLMSGGNEGVLCLYGEDSTISAIERKYTNILLIDRGDIEENGYKCKIAFISRNVEKNLAIVIDSFNKKRVLTISLAKGFINSGGSVYIKRTRRGVGLEINKKGIENLGIEINPLIYNITNP